MAKRKTLPGDFRASIESGDMDALRAVFDKCELDAYDPDMPSDKNTALHIPSVPGELVRWLVEQGLSVDVRNHYGQTPLHRPHRPETVRLLLELGADADATDNAGCTPLHYAADGRRVEIVRILVERGTKPASGISRLLGRPAKCPAVDARTPSPPTSFTPAGYTPLDMAVGTCQNSGIAAAAQVAEILIGAGAKITHNGRQSVERIAREFHLTRNRIVPDMLAETETGLARLCEMFGCASTIAK